MKFAAQERLNELRCRSLRWLILPVIAGLVSCSSVTTVKEIQRHPHRNWLTATVRLQGVVGDRIPLLEQAQVYELTDSTGSIWVLTQRRAVTTGEHIVLQGQVRFQAVSVLDPALGEAYIQEQWVKPVETTHSYFSISSND